tara:strand:- start:241 stop:1179 length:939 start_codon:yes stop_codon:yes gene_type:complete
MYKFAIWSLSNHFQSKVLPSIKKNNKIKINYVLTKKTKKKLGIKNIKWLKNKEELISQKNLNFVYISSLNSDHYENAKFALQNKINVICEKPICLKSIQLNNLITIAKREKTKLFEVIQYIHHPVFLKLNKLLQKKVVGKIKSVESEFKIPLNDRKNFRFSKKYGGGAINDVGFYPISLMFTLFKSKRIKFLKTNLKKSNHIDLKGDLLAKNENGIIFRLGWGFNLPYKNFLKINGDKGFIEVQFIFSKKIIQRAEIIIQNPKLKIIKIKKANQINLAFNNMINLKKDNFRQKLILSNQILKIIEKLHKKLN